MTDIKYPHITVKLLGADGNASAILGKVNRALRHNNVSDADIKIFQNEAMLGDYDHLLATVMRWVNVE